MSPANLDTAEEPNLSWQLWWFVDIVGLEAGQTYVFFVAYTDVSSFLFKSLTAFPIARAQLGATNQASAAITTGTPVGSYDPANSGVLGQFVKISAGSAPVTTVPALVPPRVPDAPLQLTVSAFSNAFVLLSWDEPVTWGVSVVHSYVVSRSASAVPGSGMPSTVVGDAVRQSSGAATTMSLLDR